MMRRPRRSRPPRRPGACAPPRASTPCRRSSRWRRPASGVDAVIEEFETHRLGAEIDGDDAGRARRRRISARSSPRRSTDQARIDQMTDRALVARWPIDRIDPTLRALFRAAGAELVATDTPPKVDDHRVRRHRQGLLPRRQGGEVRQRRPRPHGARGAAGSLRLRARRPQAAATRRSGCPAGSRAAPCGPRCPRAEPLGEVGPDARPAGRILPGEPVGEREGHRVRQPAVLVASAAARPCRAPSRAGRRAGRPASCGSRRPPRHGRRHAAADARRARPSPRFSTCLPARVWATRLVLRQHEAVAGVRGDEQPLARAGGRRAPATAPRSAGRPSAAPARPCRGRRAASAQASV